MSAASKVFECPPASADVITPGSGKAGVSVVYYPAGSKPEVTMGYWAIRGLGHTLRSTLAYAKIPFADVRYQQAGAPSFERSAWNDAKPKVGLDFPNLPYYYENGTDLSMTQSSAILRHIARKKNMYGADIKESAHCDMVYDTAYDLKNEITGAAYASGEDKEKRWAKLKDVTVPKYFSEFEAFRTRINKKWMVSESVTFADFLLAELMFQLDCMFPGVLEPYPRMREILTQFDDLPAIKEYKASPNYFERPVNNMFGFQ